MKVGQNVQLYFQKKYHQYPVQMKYSVASNVATIKFSDDSGIKALMSSFINLDNDGNTVNQKFYFDCYQDKTLSGQTKNANEFFQMDFIVVAGYNQPLYKIVLDFLSTNANVFRMLLAFDNQAGTTTDIEMAWNLSTDVLTKSIYVSGYDDGDPYEVDFWRSMET